MWLVYWLIYWFIWLVSYSIWCWSLSCCVVLLVDLIELLFDYTADGPADWSEGSSAWRADIYSCVDQSASSMLTFSSVQHWCINLSTNSAAASCLNNRRLALMCFRVGDLPRIYTWPAFVLLHVLNRSFYRSTSSDPVSVLILFTQGLWSQTLTDQTDYELSIYLSTLLYRSSTVPDLSLREVMQDTFACLVYYSRRWRRFYSAPNRHHELDRTDQGYMLPERPIDHSQVGTDDL